MAPNRNLFVLIAIIFTLATHTKGDDILVRSELKQITQSDSKGLSTMSKDALSDIVVTAQANRNQIDPSQGLQLDLYIDNRGTEAVEILDPTEFLQIQVINRVGFSVSLPPVRSAVRLPKNHREQTSESAQVKHRAFYIVHSLSGEGLQMVDDTSKSGKQGLAKWKIAPGEQCEIRLKINHVLVEPEKYAAHLVNRNGDIPEGETAGFVPGKTMSIPAGEYTVKVWLGLVTPEGKINRTLESEQFKISLEP